MKKTGLQTAKILFTAVIVILFTAAFTNKNNKPKENMANVCLEITGKIKFDKAADDNIYRVDLIHYNTVIKSIYSKNKSTFRFLLEKNAYYTIRVSKEGYASKMVSICTVINDKKKADVFCKFHFDTNLMKEVEAMELDKEALDFPVALISYDARKGVFFNSEKYTANIKKQLYSTSTANR
ncbi:MAG: hypothetical protein K0S33_2763 [Bacteroidetes bacterium]|jgi:hypothetical protein|nr:hypothetical protein [Bacteroidota bacterium]